MIDYPAYITWMRRHPPEAVMWCPVPDTGVPSYEDALGLIDSIVERLREGQSVVLHCSAGIGRSGMIAAATLARLGVPVTEAVDAVRRQCHGAQPEDGPQLELVQYVAEEP